MTTRTLPSTMILAAALAGCMSANSARSPGGYSGGAGGSMAAGSGGVPFATVDAGVGPRRDGGPAGNLDARGQLPISLATDAPVFNWDTRVCTGCNEGGGAGGAAGNGAGGSAAAAGGSTKTGSGGMGGAGAGGAAGAAAGGSSSSGGSPGSGGRVVIGGMTGGGRGGATSRDGGADLGTPAADAMAAPDLSGTGPEVGRDASAWSDAKPVDSLTPCTVQLRALVPATSDLSSFPLTAGAKTQVVLRAEILSGGPAAPIWDWQVTREGGAVSGITYGKEDNAAVAIPIASAGSYAFKATARSSLCSATVQAYAVAADACAPCDHSVMLRAAPPPTAKIPVQSGPIALAGATPFSQTNVVLAKGVPVLVSPSVGARKIDSYIRINTLGGDLVADGLAESQVGFGTQLLATDNNLTVLKYDVLVVPIDGPSGSSVAATAPQLFQNLTPDLINASGFALSGGITVKGNTTAADGVAVADARVMLTNRDPSIPTQPTDLLFSSVGRANAQGGYELHTQRGPYWISISPPNGSGLPEALAPDPVTLSGDTTISFQWRAPTMAALTLSVYDASGSVPLDGARVRLTSAEASKVGTLSISTGGVTASQEANGNVRVEGTTSAGTITFANLPGDATYDVLIVPQTLGANATTTSLTVSLPVSGATRVVQAAAQGWIAGKLEWGAPDATPDWSRVHLVAYDRSVDTPEPPQTVGVGPDGSYAIGVSPGRPYVVLVVPDVGVGLARTFVGPGALQASEFQLTQKVQAAMAWRATVMDEFQNAISGTALQTFCGATWPNCVDPTIPLGETTSGDGGAFELAVPDPSTR